MLKSQVLHAIPSCEKNCRMDSFTAEWTRFWPNAQIFRKESIRRRWMDSLSFSAVVKNTFWKKTLRESIRRTFFINRASPFGHFRVHSANFRVHSATLLIDSASFRVHSAAIRAHSAWIRVHSAGESIRQQIVDTILNYIGRFSACNNFSGFELSKPLFPSVILTFNFFRRWWWW